MLRGLGSQEGSGMEGARGVHEWGEHSSPAKHYKVRESQQWDSQQGIPGCGAGKKSGPAAPGLLVSGSLLGAFSLRDPSSSERRDAYPSTPPNPGRQCTPQTLPPGPRAGTSCAAGEQGQASLENKRPETQSLCGQGQNPSVSLSRRIHISRDAWAAGGWGSQADFSQMGEIWLKFHQWLMLATAGVLDTTGTSPANLAMLEAGWILEICHVFGHIWFSPWAGAAS